LLNGLEKCAHCATAEECTFVRAPPVSPRASTFKCVNGYLALPETRENETVGLVTEIGRCVLKLRSVIEELEDEVAGAEYLVRTVSYELILREGSGLIHPSDSQRRRFCS
jgi:hypothetical protein